MERNVHQDLCNNLIVIDMRPEMLLINIGQLATLEGHSKKPKVGEELNELSIIENGAIAIEGGIITAVGPTEEIL